MSVGTAAPAGAKRGKARTAALWALTGLLACLYLFSGSMKFTSPEAARQFEAFGYPDWFRVLVGAVEVGAALALLVPRAAFYAAGALVVVMAGAVGTHLRAGELPQSVVPLVLLGLLGLVAYARRGPAR
jgi:uncharacterized membrane protein YphA (DoxX/SURF4 family)